MIADSIKSKKFLFDVFDVVTFFVFSLGIVVFVRFFLFTPFSVVGQSMAPTFDQGDFIIVEKISTQQNNYQRGDVIVFLPPNKNEAYIKRIIGLPGETVKIIDGDVTICWVDGECDMLDEPYLTNGKTHTRCSISEFYVQSWYFVMGDNRDHSTDSRCCFWYGCYEWSSFTISNERILWKVWFRLFPSPRANFMQP